ncbi:MAG: fructose-bisphosphate aldolase class I, partial [Candidatus Latescibacteria bacterium]|nr:fructose-bisphosphate aldolase class I [Candidatus Latescibacterota bacterium]
MSKSKIDEVARAMVANGKGILAADESSGTIAKRFKTIETESTPENHRKYRDMLFTTPGIEQFVSGVILFDETIRQSGLDGTPFPELLAKKGIIPGIKVDGGLSDLAGFPGDQVTQGLDGLRERLSEYYDLGARFAKWRAVINIGDGIPSAFGLDANAHALARYAALCQEAAIVPIVEPEVLLDGEHDIDRCDEVTEATLRQVFIALAEHRVRLEGMILKPSMVISGASCQQKASTEDVADRTVHCFERTVPSAVPGIAFLSGGQTSEQATAHLNAMNARFDNLPWQLSFSYGRAL